MDISVVGKSCFTEDGFRIEHYSQRQLNKALQKINRKTKLREKTVIVTATKDIISVPPIITTYDVAIEQLVEAEYYLLHFNKDIILPTINGIIIANYDPVSILGYGDESCHFIAIESSDKRRKALIVSEAFSFYKHFNFVFRKLENIFGKNMTVKILGLNDWWKIRYNEVLESIKKRYRCKVSFDFMIDKEFEMYSKEKGDEPRNHVIILK